MNMSSLDSYLRSLTKSELNYRDHGMTFNYDSMPKITRNGQDIYWMNSEPNHIDNIENIRIKKHSRFQSFPTHIHNWIEINYMYSGCCPQIIGDLAYILKKGQVILIDMDTPHATEWLGEDDIMISVVINKEYLNTNFFNRMSKDNILSSFFINAINKNTRHDNYIIFQSENSRRLPIFFNELLCEFYAPSINSVDIFNSLFNLVLSELINVYEKDISKQELKFKKNSIIPILRYIEGNYLSCTLETTAAFFNMNPNYLTTLLKQNTGSSYKELVQTQRLAKASQLLRNTEQPITKIANQIGYENMSFFYKKFKEKYGCSPKEFRDTSVMYY